MDVKKENTYPPSNPTIASAICHLGSILHRIAVAAERGNTDDDWRDCFVALLAAGKHPVDASALADSAVHYINKRRFGN